MSQAIVDPMELRRFATHLKQFNTELRDRSAALQSHLHNLGDTWRDQEHEQFIEQFQQTMQVIQVFLETSDQHIPFLLRKAQRIEDYLRQR